MKTYLRFLAPVKNSHFTQFIHNNNNNNNNTLKRTLHHLYHYNYNIPPDIWVLSLGLTVLCGLK